MATKLDRSSDVPDFDNYPANPPKAKGFLRTDSSTRLEDRARQVGSAMGRAVVGMRKTQERLKDIANQTGEAAASRIEHVKNMAQEWTEAATARADELRQATVETVSEVGSQIKSGYYRTRRRANQVVREYPLQTVVIAGAIGFLFGVGLRIWRMNREH